MSTLKINECGAYERELVENWAAAYAKRLTDALADGSALENDSICSRHIREGNITTDKIHDGDVTTAKLDDGAVTTDKIKDGAVTTARLGDNSVTFSKLSSVYTDYTPTPTKIGSWYVNNSRVPVWRAAIDRIISNYDISDASYNVLDDITKSRSDVDLVLEGRAVLTTDAPCCIDTVDCLLEADGNFIWNPQSQSSTGFTHIVGYIVFVTEESNIRSY